MKKFLVALLVVGSASAMVVADAEARRMGGGGSFGRQSQGVTRQAPPAKQSATPAQQSASPAQQSAAPGAAGAAGAAKAASPWKGMLGGALLGLGLGALLSHLGLGPAMASLISTFLMIALLALAAMFIYRMVMRRRAGPGGPRPAYAGAYQDNGMARNSAPEIGSRLEPSMRPAAFQGAASPAAAPVAPEAPAGNADWEIPADFDVAGFVRNAKTAFIRLQAAWDRADLNDIREFTTPEMFAELKMQISERGASANHTDVVSVDAEMLGVETLPSDYMASVRFTGMIREEENAQAEPFAEVWNMVKPRSGQGGWTLAGIQQLG
ncbi:MAG: Tim44 domain-containing protein [Noviherbaspirillum sp.]